MSLMMSRQKPVSRWQKGDLIDAASAGELLGYKSAKQFQDAGRLELLAKEFEAVGCRLTTNIYIGASRRFLRSEIDAYLTRLVENAINFNEETRQILNFRGG